MRALSLSGMLKRLFSLVIGPSVLMRLETSMSVSWCAAAQSIPLVTPRSSKTGR